MTSPRTSTLATWALGLALIFVVPVLPVLGAILGVVAILRIRGSGGRLTGEGRAWTAVVIGTLAGTVSFIALYAVVLPGLLGGGARAQIVSAEGDLRDIERGLYRYYAARGRFPVGETPWTPETPCCDGERATCRLDPEDWTSNDIWLSVGFVPRTRPSFQLRYQSDDGRDFVVEARGDVGCNGDMEVLRMRGGIGGSGNPKTETIERAAEPTAP